MARRLVYITMLIAAAGCSGGGGKERGEFKEVIEGGAPEKVVEKLFEELSFGGGKDYSELFSPLIPAQVREAFLDTFRTKREIVRFSATKDEGGGAEAKVTVKYIYYGKGADAPSKKQLGEEKLTLTRAEGAWRIRRLGGALDAKVEENIFFACLNTVMDASIAQEMYHGSSGRYAGTTAELGKFTDIDIGQCRELTIKSAGKKDYTIVASTLNFVPCSILAASEGVIPTKYGECLER
ncbi:MAG: hypothetical protein AB1742_01310 [bacterium]